MLSSVFKKTFKYFLIILFLGLLGFLILLVDTGLKTKNTISAGQKLFLGIINNQTDDFEKNFESWQKNLLTFEKKFFKLDRLIGNFFEKKYNIRKFLGLIENVTLLMPDIVGRDEQKTYFILLQNDRELRPSGGFMGSYGKLKFVNGGLNEVIFQDIYVPDGQIVGRVEPPWPIQEAFKQGWWRLRDANWDPDFPKAALTINWFFQKGKEEKADGIIAINFSVIQKLLKILGSFYLPDYNQNINADNLYQIAQSYSEVDFFPGSTQKKDVISGLGRALLTKIKDLKSKEISKILPFIYQSLEERQILLSFFDPYLASTFNKLNWNGSMRILEPSTERLINDYLYFVETNLGANKANCCIERKVTHEVDLSSDNVVKEKLIIEFKNTGKFKEGIPPFFWGGTYVNFLRIYFPLDANLKKIIVDGQPLSQKEILLEKKEEKSLQGAGFFIKVPAQKEARVEVTYQVSSFTRASKYHLVIQKQPGIEYFPYFLTVKTNRDGVFLKTEREIRKDEEVSLVLYNEK